MLSAVDLCVTLSGRAVLADVALDLKPGTLAIVVGPNGAGKSTLLKTLTGTLTPTRGQVLFDGEALSAWPRRTLAARRAVLAQSQHVAFPFTVFEVVALGHLSAAAGRSPDLRRRIVECLAAVDFSGYEGRYFQQLSGGEQQRVHIARVLCQIGGPAGGGGSGPPRWLFLDEPTQSLDIAHQLVVLDLARRHVRAGGGALAILHDLNLASLYADRLIVIQGGNIAADGAPASVLTDACVRSVFGDRVRVLIDAVNGQRYVLPSEYAA